MEFLGTDDINGNSLDDKHRVAHSREKRKEKKYARELKGYLGLEHGSDLTREKKRDTG
jgi:hypothetical protein